MVADLRSRALSHVGAWEDYPFGPRDMVFKCANGRMFLICHEQAEGRLGATVKCTPAEAEAALLLPFVRPAPYLARAHWVALEIASPAEFEIACQFIARSYDLVAPRPPAKPRRRR